MYKFLLILLFPFLIADESIMYLTTEGWEKSDRLKVVEGDIEKMLTPFIDEMNNLLNPDKFLIKIGFKIIDTTRIENILHDSLMSTIKRIENRYFEEGGYTDNEVFSFYKLTDSGDYCEIRTTKFIIEVNVDNSIELDSQIQDMIWETARIKLRVDRDNFSDILMFNSVDIDKLKNTKKQVSLNRDDIYDDSWAVIIGIDKYDNLSNLDYAVDDAVAVKDMLINKFDYPKENVKLLLNEEANKTNIVNVISDVSLKAGENDRILVFYAGHGETMPLPDGGEMGYLVPIDGKQENLLASAIPMDDLKRFSNVSKAKHMLFLVDACYGGLAAVGSRGLEPAKTPNYIEKISNIKSRQIITAGGKNEKVFEKSEWGHSAYTKNLLSALEDGLADSNGDGYITADELGDYLSEKVSIDSENQQTPQSRRLTSHEGEFIFFNSSGKKPFSGIKPKIGKEGLKTIKVQVISEQRLIDYSKFLDNDRLGFLRFKNGATKKDYKIITQSELIDFKSSLIRMFKNKYYYQNYNFVDYSDINNANHNILYSWGDSTINQVEISDNIMNECDCYDVWLIGILQVADDKGNIYYEAQQTGHTLQNRNTKFSYRLIQWHGFIKDSLENIISSLDKEFYDSEIFPRTYLNGKIVSTIHDTLLIKFNGIVNEELIEGLTFNVKRPYYIDTYSTPRSQRDSTRYNNHEIYLDDLTRIIKYINNNNEYSDFLEEYEIKINEFNERIDLVDETYSSWRENLSIEIKIVGKREELFLGKIIKTKYPWYKPKTKDVIVLHK